MSKGDKPLTLTLKNLSIGRYSLRIYGSIDPNGRTAFDRVWKPCPMEFAARDAKGLRWAARFPAARRSNRKN